MGHPSLLYPHYLMIFTNFARAPHAFQTVFDTKKKEGKVSRLIRVHLMSV